MICSVCGKGYSWMKADLKAKKRIKHPERCFRCQEDQVTEVEKKVEVEKKPERKRDDSKFKTRKGYFKGDGVEGTKQDID